MMVADNGADWYVTGAPNRGWSNDQLHTLGRVKGSSFEVVDTSRSCDLNRAEAAATPPQPL